MSRTAQHPSAAVTIGVWACPILANRGTVGAGGPDWQGCQRGAFDVSAQWSTFHGQDWRGVRSTIDLHLFDRPDKAAEDAGPTALFHDARDTVGAAWIDEDRTPHTHFLRPTASARPAPANRAPFQTKES